MFIAVAISIGIVQKITMLINSNKIIILNNQKMATNLRSTKVKNAVQNSIPITPKVFMDNSLI